MLSVLSELTVVLAEVNDLWMYAFLAVLLVVVLIVPRRLAKRSKLLDPPNYRRTAQEEIRHSMDRLLVELQETARDINATLDTKMIVLKKLIDEADRRIAMLQEPEPPDGDGPKPVAPPAKPAPQRPTPKKPSYTPPPTYDRTRSKLEQTICALADEGKTELEIARLTGTPRGEVELVLSLREKPGQ
jgi:hypothetical protein